MTDKIEILNGTYNLRGKTVDMAGYVFPLVSEFRIGVNGGFVTVDARGIGGLPDRNIKIACNSAGDYVSTNKSNTDSEESDAEIIERMRDRFAMLDEMTKASKRGDIRAMIVSGPPGVGKSFGVEKVLGKHDVLEHIGGSRYRKYEIVKGAMSAIGLYCKLFEFADKDNVVVFDDCDSIFADELSLNILKAALDSKKKRTIHWNTDSYKLKNEGVPASFDFEGSAIFITNVKFDNVRSKKLRDHLEALESRCHYIDLTIDTDREKMLRIQQIVGDGMLKEYGFTPEQEAEIVDFVDTNKNRLRELSLRTVVKISDLVKAFPQDWEKMATTTIFKR